MSAVDKAAVEALRNVAAFVYEHGACGHKVAVGHGALGHAVAVGHGEAGTSCGEQAYGGVLIVFAIDGVVAGGSVDAEFFAVDAQVADWDAGAYVEV